MTQFTAYQKKQLALFALLTLAFLSLFTVLYARCRDTTLLSLLMLTPALSVLIVNKLTHERRSLFLRPKFKRNLSRYALSCDVYKRQPLNFSYSRSTSAQSVQLNEMHE